MAEPAQRLPRDKGRMLKALQLSPAQRLELLERMVREARLLRQAGIAAARRPRRTE